MNKLGAYAILYSIGIRHFLLEKKGAKPSFLAGENECLDPRPFQLADFGNELRRMSFPNARLRPTDGSTSKMTSAVSSSGARQKPVGLR
jgi:hypothetical protein